MNTTERQWEEKPWEKDLAQVGMHWTGSPADWLTAQSIAIQMCAAKHLKDPALEHSEFGEDWHQEMVVNLLTRLEKFDPTLPSDHDRQGNETPNPLKKFLLENRAFAAVDAYRTIAEIHHITPKKDSDAEDELRAGENPESESKKKSKKRQRITFESLDTTVNDEGVTVPRANLYPDLSIESNDSYLSNKFAIDDAVIRFAGIAGVTLQFLNDKDGRHAVMRRFFPICYSEHLAYAARIDMKKQMLNSKTMRTYKKDILYSLEWNYLRFIAHDLPEAASLEAMYGMQLKRESEILNNGVNEQLIFIGEWVPKKDESSRKSVKKSTPEPIFEAEDISTPFFLKEADISRLYYEITYSPKHADDLVYRQRKNYLQNIMPLLKD